MVYYIFTRNKKTGKKKIVDRVDSIEEARKRCRHDETEFMEFTEDYEYAR